MEAGKAVIRMQDDGDGMNAETLPKIFEMFTRGEKAMDSASEGLGIGLAVVKNLVQLHGGIIEVQSGGPGHGSEFTLSCRWCSLPPCRRRRSELRDQGAVATGSGTLAACAQRRSPICPAASETSRRRTQ